MRFKDFIAEDLNSTLIRQHPWNDSPLQELEDHYQELENLMRNVKELVDYVETDPSTGRQRMPFKPDQQGNIFVPHNHRAMTMIKGYRMTRERVFLFNIGVIKDNGQGIIINMKMLNDSYVKVKRKLIAAQGTKATVTQVGQKVGQMANQALGPGNNTPFQSLRGYSS